MFNFSDPLFIRTLLNPLVLSVAGRWLGVSVRGGMGVKNPDINIYNICARVVSQIYELNNYAFLYSG